MDAVCKALECAEAALEALLKDDQGLAVGLCFVLPGQPWKSAHLCLTRRCSHPASHPCASGMPAQVPFRTSSRSTSLVLVFGLVFPSPGVLAAAPREHARLQRGIATTRLSLTLLSAERNMKAGRGQARRPLRPGAMDGRSPPRPPRPCQGDRVFAGHLPHQGVQRPEPDPGRRRRPRPRMGGSRRAGQGRASPPHGSRRQPPLTTRLVVGRTAAL